MSCNNCGRCKKNITEGTDNYRYVRVMTECVVETEHAIGLMVKRADGVVLPSRVYLPKSQCTITTHSMYTEIKIPEWLYRAKLPYGQQIFTGM